VGLTFEIVDPSRGLEAFNWFAAANNHLFPRTWDQYSTLAEQGRIICARENNGNFVGLSYFNLEHDEWEIGGVMVSRNYLGLGIGSILMRLTLGHILFEENPLDAGETIIAHVHSENNDPRKIIEAVLNFRHRKIVEIDGSRLPGLKTDKDGKIRGDKFEITIPDSLNMLAKWCSEWKGVLKNKKTANIVLREGITLQLWATAFSEMADNYS